MRARLPAILLIACCMLFAPPAQADDAAARGQYYEAYHAETADGDWARATELYERVLANPDASQDLRDRARRRLAVCLRKLGRPVSEDGAALPAAGTGGSSRPESHVDVFGHLAQPCTPCHVPHEKKPAALWAKGQKKGRAYADLSTLCTGCHDGFVSAHCSAAGAGARRRHHPIGVVVGGTEDAVAGLPLFQRRVECATCHFSHQPEKGASTPFLRVAHEGGMQESALCTPCHQAQERPPLFYPPPIDTPRIQHLATYVGSPGAELREPPLELAASDVGLVGGDVRHPYGLVFDSGKLLVCDEGTSGVQVFDLATGRYEGARGTDVLAHPVNLARSASGELLALDRRGGAYLLPQNGGRAEPLGELHEARPFGVVSSGERIALSHPAAHAVDLYVRGTGEFDRRIALTVPQSPAGDPVPAAPGDLATDPDGNLLVGDTVHGRVLRVSLAGETLAVFGAGYLVRPKGLACDREGRTYVVDAAYSNVQVFDRDGALLLAFGAPERGRRGGLHHPAAVTIDYDHTDLFAARVAPGREIEYLIAVTNQAGARKVEVYGFLRPGPDQPAEKTPPPDLVLPVPDASGKEFVPASTHPSVASRKCGDCHTHGDESGEARAEVAAWEACVRCHEEAQRADDHPDRLDLCKSVAHGDCVACHEPHVSKHPDLLKSAIADLCLDCHEK